ncbi:autotransporter outer membrane beta-barrel domain-containing protein [Sphingopyxis lindanitolerans]|uniref:autotransporter outer membrane beta-barrel domain-containing protein n=1 Tax=Sphingopyxis lindanitolerans TaxID=2054227 RepID=UPI001304D141|nr:autotransporter outer membrane beta-barrel domain-containing protein [Sphingopyxis lindanitolerans]
MDQAFDEHGKQIAVECRVVNFLYPDRFHFTVPQGPVATPSQPHIQANVERAQARCDDLQQVATSYPVPATTVYAPLGRPGMPPKIYSESREKTLDPCVKINGEITMITTNLLKSSSVIALVVGASFAFMAMPALANDWTGAVDNDWNNPGNWSDGVVPPSGNTFVDTTANAPIIGAGVDAKTSRLVVGFDGTGSLTVRDGGTLTQDGDIGVGGRPLDGTAGNGTLLITGAGSRVTATNGRLFLATRPNSQGRVTIDAGGVMRVVGANIGSETSTANITVTGAGSLLDLGSLNALSLGSDNGPLGSASLSILDGGRVTSTSGDRHVVGRTGTITIGGANSALILSSRTDIDGSLIVENGGLAQLSSLSQFGNFFDGSLMLRSGGRLETIGSQPMIFNERTKVLVSGAGTQWTTEGGIIINARAVAANPIFDFVIDDRATLTTPSLLVGPDGIGAITVQGGATVTAGSFGVGGGQSTGVNGRGTMLITGAGTLVTTPSQIYVAPQANSQGNLTVAAGAVLRGNSLQIGIGEGATGIVTVTGADSLIDHGGLALLLGNSGANPGVGTLNILDGGQVTGSRGGNSVGIGSAINISGANSLLSVIGSIFIDGTLLVENGGAISYTSIGLNGTASLRNARLSVPLGNGFNDFDVNPGGSLIAENSTVSVGSSFNVAGSATLHGIEMSAAQIEISQNGVLNIGGADGAAAGDGGTLTAQSITVGDPDSRLVFNHSRADLIVSAPIIGNGRVLHRAGTTILTTGAHTGSIANIDVTGGRLFVDGRVSARNLTLEGGATLGGAGTLNGSVAVTDGIVAPGNRGVGTLTLGNLSLTAASVLNFELGAPGTPSVGSDLIKVGNIDNSGNLTLDGTLNVTNVGGFGAGLYRLIDYNGGLTNEGLNIGATPAGFAATDLTVQTAVARQVNLLVAASAGNFSFWDGPNITGNNIVDGGTGTWTATGPNWTGADGAANGAYDPTTLLIFAGTGGTVTVDNSAAPITIASGMQFATNGYTLTGGALELTTPVSAFVRGATIRVGDGTAAGADIAATIKTALTGPSGFDKTDLGTLRLTGASSINGEVGVLAGNLTLDGGTLETSALRVAPDPGSTATVLVTGGAVLTTMGASVAPETDSTGTVTISGEGSRWNIVGAGGVRVGSVTAPNARGLIDIVDGGVMSYTAAFRNDPVLVSNDSGIRVSGASSRFEADAIVLFNTGRGGAMLLENGGVARVENAEFGNLSSLTVQSGGRFETTGTGSLSFGTGASMLVTGAGTQLNSAGAFSFGGNGVGGQDLVIDDNAIVTSTANTDSGLGFDTGRRLIISNGAQFNLTGGTNAGLQMENSMLLVTDASVTLGGGLLAGQRFGNSTIVLRNANFTAGSVELRAGTDRIVIGADVGEAAGGVGLFDVAGSFSLGNAATTLVLNHTGTGFTIGSEFRGLGTIRHFAGDTRFTSATTQWRGNTLLTGGALAVDGLLGDSQGPATSMTVSGGATLSGRGTIGGLVTVADGIIRPGGDALDAPAETRGRNAGQALLGGDAVGTLTFSGQLALGAASRLGFQLGAPTGASGVDSDLINVAGNLTLDGTLEVTDVGGFGEGVYRLINYGGTLTDNGLDIGTVPGGFSATDLAVQTSVASQVNLIVAAPAPTTSSFTFWDGPNMTGNSAVDGGSGTWSSAGTNWSIADGSINGVYDRSRLLIFSGTGGVVTVDNTGSPVTLENGVQFAADGYTVADGNIVLDDDNVDQVIFRVGDGTAAGAGFTATIGSALTGGAELQKTDLGTLVLTGANSYSGGTHIVNGAIRGNATSIQGNVRLEDGGTLVFDQASDGVFAGLFSGSGVVRTRGTGVLDITGSSDAFEGMTIVEAGALRLTGALGGLTRIGSAGALTGDGTLAQLDVSGRVSPGGAGIATLTVDNFNNNQETRLPANSSFARGSIAAAVATTPDIVFRAGSIYAVDLAASGAGDRINATGTATLEGGTVAITTLDADLAYTDGVIFRILNAEGGLTGTFAGLTESSAFLDFALGYDPTGAFLRLSQVRMFPDVARTINQKAAASALGTLLRPAGSDGLAVYNAVLGLDEDAARAAFDASSGEIYASLLAARQRQGFALTSRFTSRAQADLREGLGIWGGITGHDGRIDADDDLNAGRVSSDGIGGEIGIDYRGDNNAWAAGLGGGWQDGNVDLPIRASHAKNKTWHVGGYLRAGTGGPGFTAVATAVHARADTDVARSINFGTIARTASANTDISTTALGVDVRYGWGIGNWSLGPAASAGLANSRFSAFSESGADTLNLSGSGNRDKLSRYGVGGFVRNSGPAGYIDLTAYYVPGDRDDARATLSMAGSPQAFTVLAPRGSKSSVRISASSQYNITENLSLGGNLGFDQGSNERDIYGHARLSYRF